jgi:3-isopropylmalate dehydrogenase
LDGKNTLFSAQSRDVTFLLVERFDMLVATHFYGYILSDLVSELSGSLGLAGSVMASDTLRCAQALHGSAPTLAGQDILHRISAL